MRGGHNRQAALRQSLFQQSHQRHNHQAVANTGNYWNYNSLMHAFLSGSIRITVFSYSEQG
jgi:hypothetical protein